MRPVAKWLPPVLLAVVLLAPLWMFTYLPLVDYPNHLARAYILAHLDDPGSCLRPYYAVEWAPNPYLLVDLLLLVLQRFLNVETAGRLLLGLCLVTLPLAVWCFLRQANPGQHQLAIWSLPFCWNVFFLAGMLNLQLSVILCLAFLALWLADQEHPRGTRWWILMLLSTTLYFTHLFGFAVAALVTAVYLLGAWRGWANARRSAMLFLPGALLFFSTLRSRSGPEEVLYLSLPEKGASPLLVLESYFRPLDHVNAILVAAAILVAWWRNPDFRWNRPWMKVVLLLYGVFWVLPYSVGGATEVDLRILFFLACLAPAAAHIGRRARFVVPLALLLLAVRLGDVTYHFLRQQPFLASLDHSLEFVPPCARVLPVVQQKESGVLRSEYAHYWAYGVVRKEWFSPYLFHDPGVHVLRLRFTGYYPALRHYLPASYREMPDWARVKQDYDYVWAFHVPEFEAQLAGVGTLVYESGELKLYRVRKEGER